MAIKTYSAKVRFEVLEFQAENKKEAEIKINELLDTLGDCHTNISWDFVEWDLSESSL